MAKQATDHKGKEYASVADMCRAYRVKTNTYYKRLERGYSIKECLLGRKSRYYVYKRKYYKTLAEASRDLNVPYDLLVKRMKKGMSFKQAVEHETTRVTDEHGNAYESERTMCEARGVNLNTYRKRRRKGDDIATALTKEIR